MLSPIKLYTFIFRDKFNCSLDNIFTEAQVAAERRADLAGWSDVTAKLSSTPSYKDGEYTNYVFEIWGQGELIFDDDGSEGEEKSHPTSDEGVAAKPVDL